MGRSGVLAGPAVAPTIDGEALLVELYEQYRDPLLNFCQAMLRSRDEAEDAVQQTFLSAFRALRRNQRPATPKPWLYTIARNRCLTMLRARHAPTPQLNGHAPDPAERLELRESVSELLDDVAELPEQHRSALLLSEVAGLSHAEVAQVLGCERPKVKSLVFRARQNLKEARRAREIPCEEIREQLSTLRGGSLRRGELRRHLRACPSCMEFRWQIMDERSGLALLAPLFGFKELLHRFVPWSGSGKAAAGPLLAGKLGAAQGWTAWVIAGVGFGIGGGSLIAGGERMTRNESPSVSAFEVRPDTPLLVRTTGSEDAPRLAPLSALPVPALGEPEEGPAARGETKTEVEQLAVPSELGAPADEPSETSTPGTRHESPGWGNRSKSRGPPRAQGGRRTLPRTGEARPGGTGRSMRGAYSPRDSARRERRTRTRGSNEERQPRRLEREFAPAAPHSPPASSNGVPTPGPPPSQPFAGPGWGPPGSYG